MRRLWREAALATVGCAALSACVAPAYPIRDGQTPGPPPLSAPRPAYPIRESPYAAPPAPSAPAAADPGAAEEAPPGFAAPMPDVQSAPLPPPGPSAALERRDGARLELVSTAEAAGVPAAASAPAAAPVAAPSADAADAEPTPQMVVHDHVALAPAPETVPARMPAPRVRQRYAEPVVVRRDVAERAVATGEVVAASGGVLENYEVQRGDHVDALARAFSTTRRTLVEANGLRAPYALHAGDILRVPVAKAYIARSGDTLGEIARRFSVAPAELAELNRLPERAPLRAGEEIGLPSSMQDRGPIREPVPARAFAAAAPQAAVARAPQPAPRVMREAAAQPTAAYVTHPYVAAHAYIAGPAQAPPPARRLTQAASTGGALTAEHGAGYATVRPPAAEAEAALTDGQIAQAARGRFTWPVHGDILVRFGAQGVGRRNDGVDIRAAAGSVVQAAASGEVVYAGDQVPGFGNLVLIKHADGWVTAYAHLQSLNVQMKDHVVQGQSLGLVGMTGGVSQPELHFEVRYARTSADKALPVDPVLVLPVG